MTTPTAGHPKRFRVLVTCDEERDIEATTADLRRAGLPADAEVTVLTVADLLPPATGAAAGVALPAVAARAEARVAEGIAAARRIADAAAAQLHAVFPGWTIAAQAEADAPAWAIVKLADRWRPDLIVVGAHQQSPLQRLLLGSTSLAVLTHAGSSVRIARPPATAAAAGHLLLGIDGSAGADAAIASVAARHWAPAAEVRVVAALDPSLTASLEESATGDAAAAAQFLVERAAAVLRSAGLTATTAVVEGAPRKVLVDEAQRWAADCIFVGARGLRATERFLLGSVSSAVAARAHCSVEVVRARQT